MLISEINCESENGSKKTEKHWLRGMIDDNWTWNELDKTDEVQLYGNKRRTVLFHPGWSRGTAGLRGCRILTAGDRYYWEVYLSQRIFGTSIMFGIGTRQASLYEDTFVNLIGRDVHSWGLSHKGLIWHNGISQPYTSPFHDNKPTTIGVYFDGVERTLSFFKDGVDLGVAFSDLQISDGFFLYPMVASSAARTVMSLIGTKQSFVSLKKICTSNICSLVKREEKISQLELPDNLKRELIELRKSFKYMSLKDET